MRLFVFPLLTLALALPALAVDGVIEINQDKALAGGVTAADTPGYPVTISDPQFKPLSLVLTSDLVVSDPNTNGIQVFGSEATIDLNGFTIKGPMQDQLEQMSRALKKRIESKA